MRNFRPRMDPTRTKTPHAELFNVNVQHRCEQETADLTNCIKRGRPRKYPEGIKWPMFSKLPKSPKKAHGALNFLRGEKGNDYGIRGFRFKSYLISVGVTQPARLPDWRISWV